MALAAFADLAEVIGALGVIAGLVFVGFQLHQNTKQMRRGEANSAMTQGSALRQLIMSNRDVAELLVSGLRGAPLDPADELRVNSFFSEITYMTAHVWDRVRSGLAVKDEFSRGILPVITPVMTSPRGLAWWARARATFRADFVADFEALIPALKPPSTNPAPSAKAGDSAESAVAPSADAG
jgi:hypothetical protein